MGETVAEKFGWERKPVPLCPAVRRDPDPCDCGYVGQWMMRVYRELRTCPPTSAGRYADGAKWVDRRCGECKRDGEPRHEVAVGWEERCPRCGDVERFDLATGELVEQRRNPAFTGSRDRSLDEDPWTLLGMDDEEGSDG